MLTYKKTFTIISSIALIVSLLFGYMAYDTPEAVRAATDPVTYETGSEVISDSLSWTTVTFNETFSEAPVIFATPVTANNCENAGTCAGSNSTGGNAPIPTVRNVTATDFEISMCIDAGAATCATGVLSETMHWFAFQASDTDALNWIEVGTTSGVATNGTDTTETFRNTISTGEPAVWTQAQTYSQGSNIAPHAWVDDNGGGLSTTGFTYVGCVHQGTGDSCTGSQPSETFGYIAIDISAEDFPAEANFQSSMSDISNSLWTSASFSPSYTDARVMVTQNDDDGGQDPEYAWARDVTASGMDFRYCEMDNGTTCNSHTGEKTVWFSLEQTTFTPPPSGGGGGQQIIWFN